MRAYTKQDLEQNDRVRAARAAAKAHILAAGLRRAIVDGVAEHYTNINDPINDAWVADLARHIADNYFREKAGEYEQA